MAKEHEDDEDHGSDDRNARHLSSDAIHHKAQNRARNTEGKKADVAKDIAEEARNNVVKQPKATGNIDQGISSGLIKEHDQSETYPDWILQIGLDC